MGMDDNWIRGSWVIHASGKNEYCPHHLFDQALVNMPCCVLLNPARGEEPKPTPPQCPAGCCAALGGSLHSTRHVFLCRSESQSDEGSKPTPLQFSVGCCADLGVSLRSTRHDC